MVRQVVLGPRDFVRARALLISMLTMHVLLACQFADALHSVLHDKRKQVRATRTPGDAHQHSTPFCMAK